MHLLPLANERALYCANRTTQSTATRDCSKSTLYSRQMSRVSLCLKLIASSLLGSPCRIGTRVGEHWG